MEASSFRATSPGHGPGTPDKKHDASGRLLKIFDFDGVIAVNNHISPQTKALLDEERKLGAIALASRREGNSVWSETILSILRSEKMLEWFCCVVIQATPKTEHIEMIMNHMKTHGYDRCVLYDDEERNILECKDVAAVVMVEGGQGLQKKHLLTEAGSILYPKKMGERKKEKPVSVYAIPYFFRTDE